MDANAPKECKVSEIRCRYCGDMYSAGGAASHRCPNPAQPPTDNAGASVRSWQVTIQNANGSGSLWAGKVVPLIDYEKLKRERDEWRYLSFYKENIALTKERDTLRAEVELMHKGFADLTHQLTSAREELERYKLSGKKVNPVILQRDALLHDNNQLRSRSARLRESILTALNDHALTANNACIAIREALAADAEGENA